MKRISLNNKILLIVLSFTLISQIVYLYVNIKSFEKSYHGVVRSKVEIVGETLKSNLDYILRVGISINKLIGIKSLLKDILNDAPELRYIAVSDTAGQWLYYCDKERFLKGEDLTKEIGALNIRGETTPYTLLFPLTGKKGNPEGKLVLGMDRSFLAGRVKEIALDSGTVVLISILAIVDFLFLVVTITIGLPVSRVARRITKANEEGLIDVPVGRTGIDFLDGLLNRFDRRREQLKEDWIRLTSISKSLFHIAESKVARNPGLDDALSGVKSIIGRFRLAEDTTLPRLFADSPVLIRPAVFLFVFAEALSISFLPLYAKELYRPLYSLSEEVVVGLPISAFMLCTALSLPLGGAWSDVIGRKRAFFIGAVISAAGLVLTATANDIVQLIAYRAIVGVGFGIVFMTAQGFIVDTTSTYNRAEGMAIFIAAFYGGTLCGSAIGGMLADRIGYRFLFAGGAVLAVSSIFFLYMFIAEKPLEEKSNSGWFSTFLSVLPSPGNVKILLSDRNFASLLFFQAIPSKIVLIGLVYYLAPLMLKQLGNSQSDSGRYIMLYSLIMILLSQPVSRWSDRTGKMKSFIFWGGTISGLALVPFFFHWSTHLIVIGIVVLGFAHVLCISNQGKAASSLPVVQRIGVGKGLGIFRQAERAGNVLAPIVMGLLTASVGYAVSLAVIGVYTVVSSVLFLLLYREKKLS